jgi:hypothetical protein
MEAARDRWAPNMIENLTAERPLVFNQGAKDELVCAPDEDTRVVKSRMGSRSLFSGHLPNKWMPWRNLGKLRSLYMPNQRPKPPIISTEQCRTLRTLRLWLRQRIPKEGHDFACCLLGILNSEWAKTEIATALHHEVKDDELCQSRDHTNRRFCIRTF